MIVIRLILLFSLLVNCNAYCQGQNSELVAEKVYLHIDRDYYYPGDDIWFKAYVIDAISNKPSSLKTNLHIELISPDSEILQSKIVKVEGGVGHGDFHLAALVPSGNYTLRAYTNFMRNFDGNLFFMKKIFVINPTDSGKEPVDSEEYIKNRIEISFFPEGGSLVEKVQSRLAFKSVNANGTGSYISGKLYSSEGDYLTDFESNDFGMGVLYLTPLPGLDYYVIIKNREGEEFRSDLPKVFSKGIVMRVLTTYDKNMIVKVFTNKATLPSVRKSEIICTFSSRNLITKKTTLRISSLVNNFLIPLEDFPEGIIRVTLSEKEGLPLCERLIYLQKNADIKLLISPDKKQYIPREHAKMILALSGDTFNNEKALLSVSVVETDLIHDSLLYPGSIASWFLLESDVHGKVENPSWYFDNTNENRFRDLDMLLLTQGWRDFQWKYDTSGFFGNDFGFSVSGRLKRIFGSRPVQGARISIGIFGQRSYSFLTTKTDSAGRYNIEGLDFSGRAKLIVTALDEKDKSAGWVFIDSIIYEPPFHLKADEAPHEGGLLLPVKLSELKQEAIIKASRQKSYKLSDTINIGEVLIVSQQPDTPQEAKLKMGRSKYGLPDKELVITPELHRYSDILKAINGRIPGVGINANEDPEFSSILFRGEEMIILRDGIPAEIREVQSLPVSMVDRVDVLHWSPAFPMLTPVGSIGGRGVINFITKSGGKNGEPSPLFYSSSLNINGFDAPRIYYSPKHDADHREAFMPDDRNTIHWDPDISIDPAGSTRINYYNADNKGSVTIVVEGITEGGIPLSGRLSYEVIGSR